MSPHPPKKINTDFAPIMTYIGDNDGKELVARLEKLKKENKTYSDVKGTDPVSNEQLQYADLVQEGGGTLGVALVGYSFVLEYLGIRFLHLAGTSAGAINTIFLAGIGEKHQPKSPELFNILTDNNFNMFNFVDGSGFAKWMIKVLIRNLNWAKQMITYIVVIAAMALLILPIMNVISPEASFLYIPILALFLIIVLFTVYQVSQLRKYRYGINPGNYFLNEFLCKELTMHYDILNCSDLDKKALFPKIDVRKDNQLGLKYDPVPVEHSPQRQDEDIVKYETYKKNAGKEIAKYQNDENIMGASYSFITADINHQMKVNFPEDAGLYWEDPKNVHPAQFVRASMAIPIFFEPYIVEIPATLKENDQLWKKRGFDPAQVADEGMFIDGGSVSNFPINKLHNPYVLLPRTPVFGVRLLDAKSEKLGKVKNIYDYAGRIINTMRSQEDKIFLRKYRFYYNNSIKEIEAFKTKVSWLDFNLSKKQKAALFLKGVEAALDFMEKFNWANYRRERMELNQ